MAKVHTVILHDTRRALKDGTYPVKLRVTYNKKQKLYSTGITLSEEDYAKMFTDKPREHYKKLLLKLNAIEKRAVDTINSISVFTFETFDRKFQDFSNYEYVDDAFSRKIRELKGEERVTTASSYECAQQSLAAFAKGKRVLLADVTPEYLKRYEKWMLGCEKSLTTVGIYLRNLRALFNDAIAAGDIDQELYPFGKRKYQIPAGRNVKKALTFFEVGKIARYEPVHEGEARARDLWLFSFFCNGINVKDIARLKYKNVCPGKITFVRAKTERTSRQKLKPVVAIITSEADGIIEQWGNKPRLDSSYVFPILQEGLTPEQELAKVRQATKTINKYIKRIAKAVGIEKGVSTYTARHSFSTVMKREGASTELIAESLGHSDLKTTESYLDSFEDEAKKHFAKKLAAFPTEQEQTN